MSSFETDEENVMCAIRILMEHVRAIVGTCTRYPGQPPAMPGELGVRVVSGCLLGTWAVLAESVVLAEEDDPAEVCESFEFSF
eukprot:scaffold133345_cov37-Tisochrysis_lutea.AAC.2